MNARFDSNAAEHAERALLGALLLDNAPFRRVAEILSPNHFQSDEHSAIWKSIAVLCSRGEIADIVTVSEELGGLERNGTLAPYVAELAQNAPGPANILSYARLVRDKALHRHLHGWALQVAEAAKTPRRRNIAEFLAEARGELTALLESVTPARGISASTALELVQLELPPLEPLLTPWLLQKNLCMVHAKRGVGKTHFALACAFAISSGTKFLAWAAPAARGVLYVDGEMPAQLMQRRIRELASSHGEVPDLLRVVTPDLQDKPMPDLATSAGQDEIDSLIDDNTSLIVIDNLSCLVRSGGAENESESWGAVGEWALKHRRHGRAVMFIHHSGKTGTQRGTSKREDLLDVVINLRRPAEYQEADGAAFEVHFEKARSLTGEDIAPLEAKLEQSETGVQLWSYTSAATRMQDRIKALWNGGTLSLKDVVQEVGCAKSHAHKTLTAAMQAGELKRPYPSKRGKETM